MTLHEKFIDFYRDLGRHSIAKLDAIYHPEVRFIDPVGEHKGLPQVEYYFTHLLETTKSCHFEVTTMLAENDKAIARWQMKMRHPRIGNGKEVLLDGVSELLIEDGKIKQQTDFYDLGTMVYEHLPVLGSLIKFVKKRMRNQ